MANLRDEFELFHDRIKLKTCSQAALAIARDGIRERIRTHFRKTLNARAPEFRSQGSFAVSTTVNPIQGEHYIEDGIYLQNLDKQSMANWPTSDIVYKWIADAVQGRAAPAQNADSNFVRVRSANQYCMDLYCYSELNGCYFRAIDGGVNWSGIHPLAFTGWFRSYLNQYGEQLRRIIRYFVAWADFQSVLRGRMPDILILTVLATYNFHQDHRDDMAFTRTLQAISNYVRSIVYVLNPVDIREELSARLSEEQKARFQEAVDEASDMANAATIIKDSYSASKLWRRQLGDRFPLAQITTGMHFRPER